MRVLRILSAIAARAMVLVIGVVITGWIALIDPWEWFTVPIPLSDLAAASTIEVQLASRPSHVITDPGAVRAFTQVLQRQEHGWRSPALGVPVGRVSLELRADERLIRVIHIGPGFIGATDRVTRYGGPFYVRHITPDGQQALLHSVGLDEQALRWH